DHVLHVVCARRGVVLVVERPAGVLVRRGAEVEAAHRRGGLVVQAVRQRAGHRRRRDGLAVVLLAVGGAAQLAAVDRDRQGELALADAPGEGEGGRGGGGHREGVAAEGPGHHPGHRAGRRRALGGWHGDGRRLVWGGCG